MLASPLEVAADAVLSRYPVWCRQGARTSLGNHGGFSGAAFWHIDGSSGSWCLRAWPSHESWPRLLERHRLMTQACQRGLSFVPGIVLTIDQNTAVEYAGRLWELTAWMPGHADFDSRPSSARLEAAGSALAQLHTAWRSLPDPINVCPALLRRLDFVGKWRQLLHSGWNPPRLTGGDDALFPLVVRAWARLPTSIEQIPRRLERWLQRPHRLQPCLCDVWHDHLLFDGDQLSGLIDYGAIKIDHVAVDLARMLGSLVPGDLSGWQIGIAAYRRFAPLTGEEEELAHDLDETGVVIGVANWLRWLYEERRSFPDQSAVVRRLTKLVSRLEALD